MLKGSAKVVTYAICRYFMPLDPIHYIISNVEVMTGEEMGNISVQWTQGPL